MDTSKLRVKDVTEHAYKVYNSCLLQIYFFIIACDTLLHTLKKNVI